MAIDARGAASRHNLGETHLRVLMVVAGMAAVAACENANKVGSNAAASSDAPVMNESIRAGAAAGLPHEAVSVDAAGAIRGERQEKYQQMEDAMTAVSRALDAASPDLATVRQNAAIFTRLGPQMLNWFPPGSGPEAGKTNAKSEIWQRPDDFAAKALAMSHAAVRFQTAAQGEDLAAMRAARADLGHSCKACHDVYRSEKR